jgi:hypothetical protein
MGYESTVKEIGRNLPRLSLVEREIIAAADGIKTFVSDINSTTARANNWVADVDKKLRDGVRWSYVERENTVAIDGIISSYPPRDGESGG